MIHKLQYSLLVRLDETHFYYDDPSIIEFGKGAISCTFMRVSL